MILGVCLTLAATLGGASPQTVFIPVERFTLAWMHSIEKVRWEEDYAVVEGAEPTQTPVLQALQARVRGSAAGMEPPPDARLRDGWYEYTPQIRRPLELRLTRSIYTADYDWCTHGQCRPMSDWLASDGDITLLRPCRSGPPGPVDQPAPGLSPTGQVVDPSLPPAKYPSATQNQ
ncbi:DUF1850 domain-containing protein [Rhodoferax ferrireducens]|uniref:DUF1850 domain-containing protein n=1 Tax=Rhodoferax ferrireducens TaxID=192843 RepID=UPI003BB4C5D4